MRNQKKAAVAQRAPRPRPAPPQKEVTVPRGLRLPFGEGPLQNCASQLTGLPLELSMPPPQLRMITLALLVPPSEISRDLPVAAMAAPELLPQLSRYEVLTK